MESERQSHTPLLSLSLHVAVDQGEQCIVSNAQHSGGSGVAEDQNRGSFLSASASPTPVQGNQAELHACISMTSGAGKHNYGGEGGGQKISITTETLQASPSNTPPTADRRTQ